MDLMFPIADGLPLKGTQVEFHVIVVHQYLVRLYSYFRMSLDIQRSKKPCLSLCKLSFQKIFLPWMKKNQYFLDAIERKKEGKVNMCTKELDLFFI